MPNAAAKAEDVPAVMEQPAAQLVEKGEPLKVLVANILLGQPPLTLYTIMCRCHTHATERSTNMV